MKKSFAVVRYDRSYSFQSGPHTWLGAKLRIAAPEHQWMAPWLGSPDETLETFVRKRIVAHAAPNAVLPNGWREQYGGA